ncbi:MAG: adenine methyltransferase [Oscillospiraceae bacterium]|nr:adenine methyltransferase [Oscillospiraceae bacterium]
MHSVLLSSKKMDWCTPKDLFDKLNKEFDFVIDVSATKETSKCIFYFDPDVDALKQSWNVGGSVFCNPPYGRHISEWVYKAYSESLICDYPIVLLIPARTDTSYFHDYIYGKSDIRFIRGRLCFEYPHGKIAGRAPFPSMIVVYNSKGSNN